jgi:SagB-type dehydrogenase family enzyme
MSIDGWQAAWSGTTTETPAWELFHENSKTDRHHPPPSLEYIRLQMDRLLQALAYDQYPAIELPAARSPLEMRLSDALAGRVTARGLEPCSLTLAQVGTVLHYAYGITRTNEGTVFSRPFRVVPSGGGLYPLELFFHSRHVERLEPGLYHYNPLQENLRLLRYGDESHRLAEALVQRQLALDTSLLLFITAVFERSTFKYGERGYRFVLLEAGHVAQNVNLVAGALGLGAVNIGGFFDRQIDDLLGLDGLGHSTVYLVGLGRRTDDGASEQIA